MFTATCAGKAPSRSDAAAAAGYARSTARAISTAAGGISRRARSRFSGASASESSAQCSAVSPRSTIRAVSGTVLSRHFTSRTGLSSCEHSA